MKVFYHTDADGKCAAWWVRVGVQRSLSEKDKEEYIPINYGMKFPLEKIKSGEKVFIVDYSISPEEMERLLQITENVVWIDHHISAIKQYEGFPHNIKGVRFNGIAACLLTFAYVNYMTKLGEGPEKPFTPEMCEAAPLFTKYIADRDVWEFKYGEKTREFTAGLSLLPHDPTDSLWDDLRNEECVLHISEMGKTVIKYRSALMEKTCGACAFETTFAGLPVFAVNQAFMSCDDYITSNKEKYSLLMSFYFNGNKWVYSLRANASDVDCSAIASQYGGGGHRGAAGFTADKLLLSAKGVS